jgi:signal transduction histidine kinase
LELPLPEPAVTKDVGIALFRVLQESLLNVTRHAGASRVAVEVSVEPADNVLRLSIKDDGVGLAPDRLRTLGSHGLGSMRHRVRAIGGQFRVQSAVGQGTEITVVTPLEAQE